jgi:hypothetical protein
LVVSKPILGGVIILGRRFVPLLIQQVQ